MKLYLQILIVVLFIGILTALVALVAPDNSTSLRDSLTGSSYTELRNRMQEEWRGVTDFDPALYERHNTSVRQACAANIIDADGAGTLRERLNELAYHRSLDGMFREFRRTNCDKSLLDTNILGLQTVGDADKSYTERDSAVIAMETYSLYCSILRFNQYSTTLGTLVSNDGTAWPCFPDFAAQVRNRRDQLISNPHYGRISHITAIRRIEDLESRLADKRYTFFNEVGSNIANAFRIRRNSLPAGDAEALAQYEADKRQALAKFSSEAGSHPAVDRLSTALSNL